MMPDLKSSHGSLRLAHGWRLVDRSGVPEEIIRNFIQPAVRSVPRALAARLKRCRISLPTLLMNPALASQWFTIKDGFKIELASEGIDGHDLAMELLLCLGQALWEAALPDERKAYLKLLRAEIEAGVPGEIDQESLREKRSLFSCRAFARSRSRLEQYARSSFAATVAEYVHCLWHDVTVRTGSEHLPALWLRRRLEFLARWLPPDRGLRLFPRRPSRSRLDARD
jgi:hypothetical protein